MMLLRPFLPCVGSEGTPEPISGRRNLPFSLPSCLQPCASLGSGSEHPLPSSPAVCANCEELDALTVAGIITADLLITLGVLILVYYFSKGRKGRASSAGDSRPRGESHSRHPHPLSSQGNPNPHCVMGQPLLPTSFQSMLLLPTGALQAAFVQGWE